MTTGNSRRAAGLAFAVLGLTIPISTAADGIVLGLLAVAWLTAAGRGSLREAGAGLMATPPAVVAALLFAALVAGSFHGEATARESWSVASKYFDLMLIPVLMWGAADPAARKRALVCFGIAVVLNLYVSLTAAVGLPGLRHPHYPIGFKASVTHNLVMSLGTFLFLLAAREATDRRWRAVLIGFAVLFAYDVVFVVIGRTGYLVLAALLLYFATVTLRGWRGPAIAIVGCAALFSTAYLVSPSFSERVDVIGPELSRWKPGAADNTSVEQRLGFYRTTLQIIAEHPFIGVGTGSFERAYLEKVKGTAAPATTNPHNDYLLIAAQIGIPGALLLVTLYVTLWVSARRLGSPLYRDLARGLVLMMAIGGLFNSILLDHTEGLLFAWLTALVYTTYNGRARS